MAKRSRVISSKVFIHPPPPGEMGPPAYRFMACVKIGMTSGRRQGMECATGSNPRKALATALRQVAGNLSRKSRRGGYFKGLGRDVR